VRRSARLGSRLLLGLAAALCAWAVVTPFALADEGPARAAGGTLVVLLLGSVGLAAALRLRGSRAGARRTWGVAWLLAACLAVVAGGYGGIFVGAFFLLVALDRLVRPPGEGWKDAVQREWEEERRRSEA
jgi:hypothetical protein